MTVTETVKEAVGLGHDAPVSSATRELDLGLPAPSFATDSLTAATRKQMSDARLPLQYRDSCANLLIPLNKCRVQNFYMPWTCTVRDQAARAVAR